jgi:hypothetical protein
MEQLASRPDVRPVNEVRPGSELMGADNFGRFPGNDFRILRIHEIFFGEYDYNFE